MTRRPGGRTFLRRSMLALAMLAALAVVVSQGSLSHTHAPSAPGLYNQEHDLTLVASVGSTGVLADTPSVGLVAVATVLVLPPISWLPRARPRRHTADRAPPLR